MNPQDLRNLMEAYGQVYEAKETTALGSRLIDPYDKAPYSDDPVPSDYKPVRKMKKMSGVVKKEETEIEEATAMAKHGHDETAIRQKIAKSTRGGEAADRATALENKPTYGDANKAKQRSEYARKQRGDFRNTTSSNPGLHGYGHNSNDPDVKAKQAARGAQRGSAALTPNERKQLNREEVEQINELSDRKLRAYIKKSDKSHKEINKKWDQGTATEKEKLKSIGHEIGQERAFKRLNREEVDVFDAVLEFLYVEGYAETLEEAAWMMANDLDAEDIQEILEEISPELKKQREERAKRLDYKDEVRSARRQWIKKVNKGRPEYAGVSEEYIDEAEGSYGQTPKAKEAMGKLAIARRHKPATEYSQKGEKTKKVKSAEKHFRRQDALSRGLSGGKKSSRPSSARGKMDADERAERRAERAFDGENTYGAGSVTKNPKKLRKQKAMGEIAKEGFELWVNSLIEEGYDLSNYTWDDMYEFYLDEAEGSYGETPKAYAAASKTKMTAKRKPFLKAMQRRTNPANRKDAYASPRKGLTADDRERARAGSAHGVGTRADHDYPSEGPGGVTKNPKKLRKQKAMGEFAKEDLSFAEKVSAALKESREAEIMNEITRYEKETGKDFKTGKPVVKGGLQDKAYQSVKKSIRKMEGGRPAGQRKQEPGKKPPKAGEYGGPQSPAQKVALRRAAAKRSQEMQSSRYD